MAWADKFLCFQQGLRLMLIHGSESQNGVANYPNHIENYQIISQLGRGAFGTVFRAATPSGHQVGIKALSKVVIKSRGLVQRVRNEVSIHYQLRHENILELLHFFEDNEYVYLVMELADGGELYRRVKEKSLNINEIRRIFAAIVDGLIYLHSHGIIHRDLKLSNILLTRDLIPKIADFGLAVKVEQSNEGEQHTLCGTPNYLAPEVILKFPYGKEADLWSLGCLLYTLVVGRPPFESADVRDTFSKVKRGDFGIPESVPPLVRDLLKRLIVLNPTDRMSLEQIRRHPFLLPPVPLLSSNPKVMGPNIANPLRITRLRPIYQRTRHGLLQITKDYRLLIDFDNFSDVMLINPDGIRTELYHKPWREDSSPFAIFDYPTIPSDLVQRYEYGRRFVSLIRAKTPQIILTTDVLKAFLMDNPTPPWDFQIRYKNGNRVEYSSRNSLITIKYTDGSESQYSNPISLDSIDNLRTRMIISECLRRYQQCLEVATKLLGGKNRDKLPFPYVISETSEESPTADFTIPHLSNLISASMATMHRPTALENEHSFEYAYKTFLPDIGWCLASSSEQFLLLFVDGQTVLIDGKSNRVSFHDRYLPTSHPKWLHINQQLPSPLKQKLSYFPKFVNLLKNGQGHSFVS